MFCPNCGVPIDEGVAFCNSCGSNVEGTQPVSTVNKVKEEISPDKRDITISISPKDKGVLILLATWFGILGIDRFYRGQVGLGILKLLTLGGCGIWALIDAIMYMVGGLPSDSAGKWIVDKKTLTLFQSRLKITE
jgi:TM2 domain-containing membrane protein YozV